MLRWMGIRSVFPMGAPRRVFPRCALLTVVVLLGTLVPARAAVTVWAVEDGVRVDPVSGMVLVQGRTDIHRDYPTGDYRRSNLVWDGEARTIHLRSARNEFVAFQVIVESDSPVREVDVSFAKLTHESGVGLEGRNVAIFKEWYVQVRRPSLGYEATSLGPGWYADALMPKRRAGLFTGFPFSIPDIFNNIPNQRAQAVWIEVFVPESRDHAPPGRFSGEVVVTWEGGREALPVHLDLWDFSLPNESDLKGDLWNGSMRNMSRKDELAYYHMARRHRFLPLVYAYRPSIEVLEDRVRIDWTDYDRRVGPYLDGSAFTEEMGYWGPGKGVPVSHVMLPFNVESEKHPGGAWPVPLPEGGPDERYEALWKDVGRQFREHFDSRPSWSKVVKVAFLNGLDESYFEEAYLRMLYYGRLLHQAMGRDWFLYRIDGGYSMEAMERLAEEVDLWVCHTVAFDLPTVEHFRRRGMKVWFYGPMIYEQRRNSGCGSNTFLDLDLNVNRGIGWVAWKYQTGYVQWEFDWNAFAAWYEAENFKEEGRYYNGSGQMIYRGEVMNYSEPIPSIRLKSTRRGLQDYEYFRLLSELTGGTDRSDDLVNSVIHKEPFGEKAMLDVEIWRNDPSEWERVRIAAGDLLDALMKSR
jgi:hypothetical protein